jgi:hypothetical protein
MTSSLPRHDLHRLAEKLSKMSVEIKELEQAAEQPPPRGRSQDVDKENCECTKGDDTKNNMKTTTCQRMDIEDDGDILLGHDDDVGFEENDYNIGGAGGSKTNKDRGLLSRASRKIKKRLSAVGGAASRTTSPTFIGAIDTSSYPWHSFLTGEAKQNTPDNNSIADDYYYAENREDGTRHVGGDDEDDEDDKIEMEELMQLKKDAEETCINTTTEHLMFYLKANPTAKYHQWVEDIHPENVHISRNLLSLDGEEDDVMIIDHRFYVETSDHRRIWNENLYAFLDPIYYPQGREFVPARCRGRPIDDSSNDGEVMSSAVDDVLTAVMTDSNNESFDSSK